MLVLQKDCSLGKGFLFQWSFFKLVDDWTSLAFNCKIIVDKYWRFIGSLYIGLQDNFDAGFNTESCTHEQLQERQARLSLLSSMRIPHYHSWKWTHMNNCRSDRQDPDFISFQNLCFYFPLKCTYFHLFGWILKCLPLFSNFNLKPS